MRNYLTPTIRQQANVPVQRNGDYLPEGTRVSHPTDGMGTVVATQISGKLIVNLDNGDRGWYQPGEVQLVLPGVE